LRGPPASNRGDIGGFKDFKAGFGNKVRGEKGGVYFEIAPVIKEIPYPFYDTVSFFKQFQVHDLLSFLWGADREYGRRFFKALSHKGAPFNGPDI